MESEWAMFKTFIVEVAHPKNLLEDTSGEGRCQAEEGGDGEGLSVGFVEVLANCSTAQEGKAGLGSGCIQDRSRIADRDW